MLQWKKWLGTLISFFYWCVHYEMPFPRQKPQGWPVFHTFGNLARHPHRHWLKPYRPAHYSLRLSRVYWLSAVSAIEDRWIVGTSTRMGHSPYIFDWGPSKFQIGLHHTFITLLETVRLHAALSLISGLSWAAYLDSVWYAALMTN